MRQPCQQCGFRFHAAPVPSKKGSCGSKLALLFSQGVGVTPSEPKSLPGILYYINEGYIDAIVASQAYLFVVEAKATIFGGTASGIFGSLEKQASRMAEPNSSLRTNLTERIIEKFRGDEWGRCSMTEAWGVLIADTLNLNRKSGQPPACPPAVEKWRHLQTSDLPTLQLYKTEVQEDSRLKEWWHLLGFTKLDALSEHV